LKEGLKYSIKSCMRKKLTEEETALLKRRHKTERSGDVRDRIKAVILSDKGWSEKRIAEALLIHLDTVQRHLKDYHDSQQKLKGESGGSESKLNETQTSELLAYLDEHSYTKAQDIGEYIKVQYQMTYTVSGITSWLKAHKFSYKKPKVTPLKADPEAQKAFIEYYENLKSNTPEDEPILFGDSVHPTMATKVSYGWIRTASDKAIGTIASRTRMNIAGVIDLSNMKVIHQEYETINGENIVKFLGHVKSHYSQAKKIHLILDQAGYHRSEVVQMFAKEHWIRLHYLPPYSPNLNPTERLWKVMNETARNNVVFRTIDEFKERIRKFFEVDYPANAQSLVNCITDNFRVSTASSF
jgi:transposase